MKTMLETLSVAFSMFSVLPVPRCAWSEKNMRFALCAFPLVGAVVGALLDLRDAAGDCDDHARLDDGVAEHAAEHLRQHAGRELIEIGRASCRERV